MKKLFLTLTLALLCSIAAATQPIKVLSLNNSLIDFNNQSQMFNDIAAAMGKDASWSKRTQLGRSLLYHYNDELSRAMIAAKPWDYIVLQEQSSLPRQHPKILMEVIELWKKYIIVNCPNPDVTIILHMNWAFSDNWSIFKAETKRLRDSYEAVVRDIPGVKLCPIGLAFEYVFDTQGAEKCAELYSDTLHPSAKGSYLAACMQYALIFGEDPSTITFVPASIKATDAAEMRRVASIVMKSYSKTNP